MENTDKRHHVFSKLMRESLIDKDVMASTETPVVRMLPDVHVVKIGGRSLIDAGKKVFTSDQGFGTDGFGILLYNPVTRTAMPHARITALSEEHGWIQVPGGSTLAVGDRVQVIPNHACVVVDTQRRLHLVRGEEVVETLDAEAGGMSQ